MVSGLFVQQKAGTVVQVNGSNSLLMNVLLGVPQGSILGPLLFLIYINDLPLCFELFALLFADDTTLLLSDSNSDNLIKKCRIPLPLPIFIVIVSVIIVIDS